MSHSLFMICYSNISEINNNNNNQKNHEKRPIYDSTKYISDVDDSHSLTHFLPFSLDFVLRACERFVNSSPFAVWPLIKSHKSVSQMSAFDIHSTRKTYLREILTFEVLYQQKLGVKCKKKNYREKDFLAKFQRKWVKEGIFSY